MAEGKKGYDPALDEEIQTFGMFRLAEDRGVYVGAKSYDNGPIRVVIQRYEKKTDKDGNLVKRFYNANRLNGNELDVVIKGLRRARKWYSEQDVEESPKMKMAASKEKKHHKKKARHIPTFKSKRGTRTPEE